jgi:transposase
MAAVHFQREPTADPARNLVVHSHRLAGSVYQTRTDSLFYYFRLEDQIPDDHRLKRLDRFIDLGFVRERLQDTCSAVGRPLIDPEVLLRLLLVGYLYGITSERRLMEEVRMSLAYRWFRRLGFERDSRTLHLLQEPA